MKKGTKATIHCPPEYGYGEFPPVSMRNFIKPNAILNFEVEVIDFTEKVKPLEPLKFSVEKLNEGTGPTIPYGSIVKVVYRGTFRDGSIFDE